MKNFAFSFLFVIGLSIAALAEDPAYSDIDAENYIVSRNITDRAEITRLHAWYTGLKGLGLWSNITHSVSYRSQHNALSGSTVVAMVGQNGTMTGGLPFSEDGVVYSGVSGNYIAFPNPLSNPVTNYTIVCFCTVPRVSGTYYALFGSYNGSSTKGPSLFADGSPQAGSAGVGFYYQYYSTDGSADPSGIIADSGLVGGPTWGTPTMVAAGISDLDYRMVTGLDVVGETIGGGSTTTTWNGNSTWRLGQTLTGALRLVGTIAYTGVWNELLTANKIAALRRLYSKTLGYGYMQKTQFIFEGDSLTAGDGIGGTIPFPTQLQLDPDWGKYASMRNNGHSGDSTTDVLDEISTQLYPFNVNFDFAKQYFSTYIGFNDMGPLTAVQIIENLKVIWKRGKDAGYRVIAYTFPKIPMLDDGGKTAAERAAIRDNVNALIRQSSGAYDILIELDKISGLQDQTNTTYYKVDQVHYTTAGHALIAAEIKRRIPVP